MIPECIHCGKTFKKAAFLKKHLEKCKEFVPKKVGQEEAVELLKSGFNKEQVRNAFKVFRKVSTKSKVEPNIMKTVNESVKDFGEKWFTSKQIRLKDSTGKKFVTCVAYCKDVKGFLKFLQKGRKLNMICHAPFQSLSWTTELYQVISDASSFLSIKEIKQNPN